MSFRTVAALSLVFTYAFFFEYLPPFRWVDISNDLQGFHYPLDDYAFQALRSGHVPEWDPSQYCGMTFAGNSQTALFYPPMWLAFLANAGNARLKYRSLEVLIIGHVWLGFLFCFLWLRGVRLMDLACVFGAGVFAYSGYMLMQLGHLGMACGYVYLPLGLFSIDRAAASRTWRPLWMLAVASAFCFLAGHPPTWFVFGALMLVYAACSSDRWRLLPRTAAALAFSGLIAAVQILPTWEASQFKEFHENYGAGIRDPKFYLSYFIPNFFDFGIHTPPFTNLGYEYLYIGAPAVFGLLCLALYPRALRAAWPALALGVFSAILLTNPYDLVWNLIRHSALLAQTCRSWNFLAGISLSAAALSAFGIDQFLRRANARQTPRWLAWIVVLLLALWSARQLWTWLPQGPGFASGWRAAIEPAVFFALFCAAMLTGRGRPWAMAALVLAAGIDYKVAGASKRFNALPQNLDRAFAHASFPGMSETLYRELRAHPESRIAIDNVDPTPMDLRHYGLTTPQGGDPLVPVQYNQVLRPQGEYYGPLAIDPADTGLMRLLGVRYFLTSSSGQSVRDALAANPSYRLIKAPGYFQVFEFRDFQPIYRWEHAAPSDRIQPTRWTAEHRAFQVHSDTGGRFVLIEQMYPGWQATVDGRQVPIERWGAAFQSISVPPGEHHIEFAFRSRSLRLGASISALAWIGLAAFLRPWKVSR